LRFAPSLVGQVSQLGETARPAGIVDQDVDPAELLYGRIDHLLHVGLNPGIRRHEQKATVLAQFGNRLLALVRRAAGITTDAPGGAPLHPVRACRR